MPIINGINRHQITFSSLEELIAKDNEVRFMDAFVDTLDLAQLVEPYETCPKLPRL